MAIAPAHEEMEASAAPSVRPVPVAVIITKFFAGAGGVALRGALAMDPARYRMTIMTRDEGPLISRAEEAGLNVVRLRHMRPELNAMEDARAFAELTRLLRRGGYRLVHTHSSVAGALGRLAARRAGVPSVVHTFHGFPFHEFQSRPRRAAYVSVERRLGRITDRFLAVGAAVAAEAVRLRIAPPHRIRAIAGPIDPGIAQATPRARAEARRRLGAPPGSKVIGVVARLDHQKAPLVMVEAVARLRRQDVLAVWIGDGELAARTARAIRRWGLEGRFLLLGERQDVAGLLPGFDVFALSSLYEGLPLAVVEAMACGVPVVATAVNAVHEVVVPGRTGLLARPGDAASLAAAIGCLLDDPDRAAGMARAARAQLGDRFLPDTLGADLADTYAQALGGRRRIPSQPEAVEASEEIGVSGPVPPVGAPLVPETAGRSLERSA